MALLHALKQQVSHPVPVKFIKLNTSSVVTTVYAVLDNRPILILRVKLEVQTAKVDSCILPYYVVLCILCAAFLFERVVGDDLQLRVSGMSIGDRKTVVKMAVKEYKASVINV